jgi:hypothetical protein
LKISQTLLHRLVGKKGLVEIDHIPFTDAGLIEAVTKRVSRLSPSEAWLDVLKELPYVTDEHRAESLNNDQWIVKPAARQAGYYVDGEFRVIVIQGGWWYRGITAVEPHVEGSLITYIVLNIATGLGRWVAHFMQAASHRAAAQKIRDPFAPR